VQVENEKWRDGTDFNILEDTPWNLKGGTCGLEVVNVDLDAATDLSASLYR
jgi:hypothetical protein